jgi:hypothetical protein
MIVQLAAYLVLSLSLYHSFQTFQFINISLSYEHAFVLKSKIALYELEPNSTYIMCSLIIDKYINSHSQCKLLSLVEFSSFYNI